jgi:hypothetical protein
MEKIVKIKNFRTKNATKTKVCCGFCILQKSKKMNLRHFLPVIAIGESKKANEILQKRRT